MRWDVVQAAFEDELTKIGAISLTGLSPQTVLERGQPAQPMETPGLSRALAILDRYEAATTIPKVAAPRVPFNPSLPGINTLTGSKKGKKRKSLQDQEEKVIERGKSLTGHTLGGMGVGRLLGEFAHGPRPTMSPSKMHANKWWATAAGGGIGALEFARKRVRESIKRKKELQKAAAVGGTPGFSPAQKLKAGRQVAAPAKTMGRFGAAGPSALSRIAKSSLKRFP